jgi:hypothetical protein
MLAIDPLHHILPKATKVPNKDTYIPLVEGLQLFVRHSADDAVIFFWLPSKKILNSWQPHCQILVRSTGLSPIAPRAMLPLLDVKALTLMAFYKHFWPIRPLSL